MRSVALDERREAITRLAHQHFDLLVIGGGITGVGVAQDAAARGLKVALVERGDYAIGTSSRSSKLIHGGLRYLAQGDFRVTYDSCAERALLQRLAPHLVHSLAFLVPVYRWAYALQLVTGLWLYDFISKLQNTRFHKRVGISRAQQLAPLLDTEGLISGYIYYDCQTNDARLVMEVLKSAASYGAVSANYLEVVELIKETGQVKGACARDLITEELIEIRAQVVLNATGVWMDGLRQVDDPNATRKVRPAKGVHIVIARDRIPTETALLFESAARDGRSLFFIPWYEGTIIGTTDTDFQGDIDVPRASEEDIDYILAAVNRIFPAARLNANDILSTYAGLRPLIDEGGKSTKDISREHRTFQSRSGLISIAGGKLTTYRRMAREVVDLILTRLKALGQAVPNNPSRTDKIYLSGLDADTSLEVLVSQICARAMRVGLDEKVAKHLVADYGVNSHEVIAIVEAKPILKAYLLPHLPFIEAEVIYAVRQEQATRVEDFLVRRTRIALLAQDQGMLCVPRVAWLMGQILNWREEQI
ncbi:MAG: glycerol-3-phosphate dehydrogenase/oxidase, partial [Acidobacteriota bacterium]